MNINDTMHPAQVAILHALLFRPSAGFAELQKASELSSDHFAFHLKKMLEQQLIHKNTDNHYELTIEGKEYANRFDTDERVVERQPKVAVLLLIEHQDGRLLYQQRLKQPFYGFWGRPTGKIRWGETITEAAARELMEETGLEADLEFRAIYHKLDFDKESNKLLEDKIFFTVYGSNPRGELAEHFDGGRNAWLSLEEVQAQEKVFEGMKDGYLTAKNKNLTFKEKSHFYTRDQY
ncbi:MAG TPA: NUDIX hydrolase [Candidatus Saccharimonadales bacterium]|nr:NUDIX hydrolase [Candidatus Saccharimonadales bacterium]